MKYNTKVDCRKVVDDLCQIREILYASAMPAEKTGVVAKQIDGKISEYNRLLPPSQQRFF